MRLKALLLIIIFSITGLHETGTGQISAIHSKKRDYVILKADKNNAFTRVNAPVQFEKSSEKLANFDVTYTNFSTEAQTAFQRAVDIWASIISSSVPIRVEANWVTLDPNVLGSASANTFLRFSNSPKPNTWYPVALAEKLLGYNDDENSPPDSADIIANFNSNFANWYLGTDGNCPAGKYDLVTVVLHELCHGLGFQGSMDADGGQGSWGFGSGFPFIFDHFAENGSGQNLLNIVLFPNPSTTLANALTNNDVYFNGPNAISVNGYSPVKLYAPATWQLGSSYSHLNEITFPAGDPNSLMTPSLNAAEVIHHPGNITLGIFEDIGWTTNLQANTTMVYAGDTDNNGTVNATDILPIGVHFLKQGSQRQQVSYAWQENEVVVWNDSLATYADANGDGIVDEKDLIGIGVNWGNTHSVNINKPAFNYYDKEYLQTYRENFKIIYNALNGSGKEVTEIKELLMQLFEFEQDLPYQFSLEQNYPNPFNPTTTIRFSLPEEQTIKLHVYNALGQVVSELIDDKVFDKGIYDIEFDASNFSNGIYIYTIQSERFYQTRKMILLK